VGRQATVGRTGVALTTLVVTFSVAGAPAKGSADERGVFAVSLRGSVTGALTAPEREVNGCRYVGYSVPVVWQFASEQASRLVVRRPSGKREPAGYRGARLWPVRVTTPSGSISMEGVCANGQRILAHGDMFGGRRTTSLRFYPPAKGWLALADEGLEPALPHQVASARGRITESKLFDSRVRTISVTGTSEHEEVFPSTTRTLRVVWTLTFRRLR
jgi:hypothetical protein